jgi:hypothetical protein
MVRALRKFAEPAGQAFPHGTLLHDCYLFPVAGRLFHPAGDT